MTYLMSRSILNSIFVVVAIAFAALAANGQKNQDVCRVWVTPWTWSLNTPSWFEYSVSDQEIGRFSVALDDHERERESYIYEAAGKMFHVAVWITETKKSKPGRIRIGLFVDESKPSITGDHKKYIWAEAMYRDKWGFLDVSKSIEAHPNRYEFHLTCSDGISEGVIRRDEPNPLLKKNK